VPAEGELDTEGASVSADDMKLLLEVDPEAVKAQLPQVEEHLARFGDRLPDPLQKQLEALKERLG
jgi:phosphoenolpyruvate carboxykinase (GTP)